MSSILSLIVGCETGDSWEELCVQCYRLRYQAHHYQAIPSVHDGDAGIEGFTNSGVVHQCYFPERKYSDQEHYEHLRKKLTNDINKLLNNGARLRMLGVPIIREWHFNIPEYRDTRILTHAVNKSIEVLEAKKRDPKALEHISEDFTIIIKVADDFRPEISRIVRTTITDKKIDLSIKHTSTPDWNKCDSEKVKNIRGKIGAVMNTGEDDESLNKLAQVFIESYISGLDILSSLQINFPEIYDDLLRLESAYKNEVRIRTLLNTNRSMNQNVFNSILEAFQQKLEKDFSHSLTQAAISELKLDLVASWLADCSMDFKGALPHG